MAVLRQTADGCNMKKIVIIILALSFNFGFGQVEIPFFEQIAFDFYQDSLLTKFPVKKRIKNLKSIAI
jgi:hypothetical protein